MTQSYFIDAHCHLDLFNNIQQNVNVEDNLLIKTISVTNCPGFFEPNTKLFSGTHNIRIALGLHPELVPKFFNQIDLFEKFITKTKYIGEIGLDGSKDFVSTYELQTKVFKSILSLIKSQDQKILTIHSRNAAKDTIDLLNTYLKNTNCKVILHWYSGNLTDLKQAVKYGYYFSVNHKMTNSEKGRAIISHIPSNLLLTETDAPFTFEEKISNRVESLKYAIQKIAGIKQSTYQEVQKLIYDNFKQLLS
jgi:TatD DNase family protein